MALETMSSASWGEYLVDFARICRVTGSVTSGEHLRQAYKGLTLLLNGQTLAVKNPLVKSEKGLLIKNKMFCHVTVFCKRLKR